MTAPRSMSFEGCRTRAEALERLKIWLVQIHTDNVQKLRTDLYAARDNGDLIDDEPDEIISTVEAVVAMARENWDDALPTMLAKCDRILAEHFRADLL